MPDRDGSPFALASALRALTDDELVGLLSARPVRRHGVDDLVTLAERLLEPTSVSAALAPLDRRTLLTLAIVDEQDVTGPAPEQRIAARLNEIDHPETFVYPSTLASRLDRLTSLGLIVRSRDEDGAALVHTLDAVHEVLAAWPAGGLPSLAQLAAPMPAFARPHDDGAPEDQSLPSGALERTVVTPQRMLGVLDALAAEPARPLARGGLGGPDLKRLAAAADLATTGGRAGPGPETAQHLADIGVRAGLIAADRARWHPSTCAAEWATSALPHRWARLAGTWLDGLGDDVREVLADPVLDVWGDRLGDALAWMFPAAGESVLARREDLVAVGELLGLLDDGVPTSAGRALLARGTDAARTVMAVALPATVDRVYVQQDLSIIAPGPLEPALEAQLRSVADTESLAVASTYRISSGSIERALRGGASATSILDLLAGIATSALPQPLRYLVDDVAARFGRLRVSAAAAPTVARATEIASHDEVLLASAAVDRRLGPLGLVLESPRLATSRFDRDIVTRALVDADYPAVAVDAAGELVSPGRDAPSGVVAPPDAASDDPDGVRAFVARLRETQQDVGESGWIERQLEVALRQRLRVAITVRMPSGDVETYTLEPTGIGGGRVRARDRRADLERTFPLSRIVAVAEAAAS